MLVSLKLTQMLGLFEELKQQMEHAEISQDKLQQSVHYLGKAFQDIRKQVNIELNAL
jgi:16S rRNA C1402 N4-methylase RsmH